MVMFSYLDKMDDMIEEKSYEDNLRDILVSMYPKEFKYSFTKYRLIYKFQQKRFFPLLENILNDEEQELLFGFCDLSYGTRKEKKRELKLIREKVLPKIKRHWNFNYYYCEKCRKKHEKREAEYSLHNKYFSPKNFLYFILDDDTFFSKKVVNLVGAYYQGTESRILSLPSGEPLTLKAEPDNCFDESAVSIWDKDRKLGYISRKENKDISYILLNKTHIKVHAYFKEPLIRYKGKSFSTTQFIDQGCRYHLSQGRVLRYFNRTVWGEVIIELLDMKKIDEILSIMRFLKEELDADLTDLFLFIFPNSIIAHKYLFPFIEKKLIRSPEDLSRYKKEFNLLKMNYRTIRREGREPFLIIL